MRRLRLALLGVSALLARSAASETARADGDGVTLAVDCPSFDPEARAALEARARTELIVRQESGTLIIVCRDASAALTWHPLSGAPTRAGAALGGDTRPAIEHILEAFDSLLPNSAPPPENPGGARPAPVESPHAPAPKAEKNREAKNRSVPPVGEPSRANEAGPSPTKTRDRWPGLVVAVGTAGELLSHNEALGVRARVEIPLPLRFAAGATGTALWTLRAPDGVNAHLWRIAVGADYAVDRRERFRVGADASFDALHAAASGAGSDDSAIFGAGVRASVAPFTGFLRLRVGPTLALHAKRTHVQLGASDVFTVPPLVVGLAVEVEAGPIR